MKHMFSAILLIFFSPIMMFAQTPAQTIPGFEFFVFSNNSRFTDKDIPTGKMIFITFFDPECDHCQRAVQNIGNNYPAFKEAAIYLVSIDDKLKVDRFMDAYGKGLRNRKNVTLLQDKNKEFIKKFTPIRYPAMFLYSPDKKLIDYEDNDQTVFRFLRYLKH